VVQVQHVGLARARVHELILPDLDQTLVVGIGHLREDAVGRAGSVLEGRMEGRVGGERVGRLRRSRVVERAHVEPGVEGARVRGVAGNAQRAGGERDVPAGVGQRAREVARHLRRPAAREEDQAHEGAHQTGTLSAD
jgi:hypothetical protein